MDFMHYVKSIIEVALVLLLAFIVLVFLIIVLHLIITTINYYNNETILEVIIDGKTVYKGEGKYIKVEQLGENGNMYKFTQYKNDFWSVFLERKIKEIIVKDILVNDVR